MKKSNSPSSILQIHKASFLSNGSPELFEIFFEGAERILFPYSIFVIYLLICTAAQTGSFTHTNKDGSRDKRFKNNSYVHSFDSSTRELYNHIAVQTLFSLIIFLIIDIIFL